MMKLFSIYVLMISMVSLSNQWNDFGHMLSTQIFKITLQQKNASLYTTFSTTLLGLNNLTGGSQSIIESSTWANDLESRGFTFLNNWHFSNIPINVSQPPAIGEQERLELNEEDLSYGLYYCNNVLTEKYLQTRIQFENAMMSRYAVHLTEDAHQPLHCATLYSNEYPFGDLQGQFYNVSSQVMNYTGNLYQVWNNGFFRFPNMSNRPLSQQNISQIESMAEQIMMKYPQSYFGNKVQITDWNQWITESNLIAWQHVYSPLLNSSNPNIITQSYIDTSYPVVEQQIALGAYRLAYWIESIYNNNNTQLEVN